MKRIYKILLFSLFLLPFCVQSQNTIKGTVIDKTSGKPLSGVNVTVQGTTKGIATDFDGKFQISKITNGAKIVFSFIGYKDETVTIGNQSEIIVSLAESGNELKEVVVQIGYGTQKKKDLTGSYTVVSSKDFQKVPFTNVEGLIANKIPGVQITPSSGKPGAGGEILIRGGSSLNASNAALIVIDGFPIEGFNPDGSGMLSQLNPDDIESFTILKDASASAIYGSRASNGVVIINTKKGSLKKTQINVSSNTMVSSIINEIPVLSADEYREVVKKIVDNGGKIKTVPGQANTNWQKEIFQVAVSSDNNISASGAYKSIPYRVSLGYLNQDGILKTSNFKRTTASLNLNPTFFDNHLKINLSVKGSSEKNHLTDNKAIEKIIWNAKYFDPTQPVHVADPTYGGYFQYSQFDPALTIINPVSQLEQVTDVRSSERSVSNIQLDYSLHFLPDLHINVNGGYDISKSENTYTTAENYFPAALTWGSVYNANPSKRVENTLFETYLFYNKELKSIKSRFDLTAGYSYNDFLTTDYNYPTYDLYGNVYENSIPLFDYDKPSHSIISFYGRLNYVLNQKYILTASLRQDGSSRFAEKNRKALFPSVALAWNSKQESFLKDSNVFSDLKLRLSYGVTGQQDGIENYYYIPGYNLGDLKSQYTVGGKSYTTVLPYVYNPNLKWEQTASANIGLDFGFLNNRISGSIDVYNKKTSDLLNKTTIPLGFSFDSTMLLNIGDMENNGIEFLVKAIPIQTDKFSWDLNFNATYNEGKITHLNDASDDGVGLFSDKTLVNTVGYPRNTFYLYHQVYDINGMPIEGQMLDVNKDGLINADDRYITDKSTAPRYILGFSTNLRYLKWSFGVSFHSNIGNYMFFKPSDNTISITEWQNSQNLSTMYYETLFSHNDQYQAYSDFYLQDASFLKMDNINIGYDFGKSFNHSKVGLKLNFSVQNVFTVTNYTGQDPEATNGYENPYPVPRVFALGLNLNF